MKRVKQCTCAAFFMVLSFNALAHPHSFISLRTEVIAESGQLTGFKMRWTMDEITSSDLLYDAGSAKPGDEVWKKLAAEVMANVLGQHYFSELWHNGQHVKFDNRPDGYGLEREGHQAVLTFTLPLAKPLPLAGQTLTLSTFDPTYYVDMFYDKPGDVTLPASLRAGCKVTVVTPKPNDKMTAFAQSLDKADAPPEDMALGTYFAQKVTLTCQ
ncbi:DUF1007 family protein [Raoultella terrigena]|uniref:DUF1007 family protein n=1 Tax=Raoultella terrigena TaxID=577 RepID=UPI000F4BA1FD|nr:DUF1007 family protein [Raoultella terrigena]ROR89137.1 ABC-type uncharacterized transport system substrate-binding protein [Raoultella terrigena]